jgi:broad specificity phosphatase PhoE
VLYLVRHAPVDLDPERPAPEWRLSERGRVLATQLADSPAWRELVLVACSPEPKAVETALPIAEAADSGLRVEHDLREAERPGTPVVSAEEYERLVAAYLAAPDQSVHGWEPAREVRERVRACVERLLAEVEGPLAVVSHGLALSLYCGLVFDEWQAMSLPAVALGGPPFWSLDEFLAHS